MPFELLFTKVFLVSALATSFAMSFDWTSTYAVGVGVGRSDCLFLSDGALLGPDYFLEFD